MSRIRELKGTIVYGRRERVHCRHLLTSLAMLSQYVDAFFPTSLITIDFIRRIHIDLQLLPIRHPRHPLPNARFIPLLYLRRSNSHQSCPMLYRRPVHSGRRH